MTRISPTAIDLATRRETGFTLVEMLVVLAIISLLIGLAATRASHGPSKIQMRQKLSAVAALMRRTRMDAMLSGDSRMVGAAELKTENMTLVGTGADKDAINWFADGSSSGGFILIGDRAVLRVDQLTGTIYDAR